VVNVLLGTVQAIATVAALYYAWRATKEASAAQKALALESRANRLDRLADAVADLDQSARNANGYMARRHQLHLRARLAGTSLPLASARQLAEMPLESL
jgi:hypothetical protein